MKTTEHDEPVLTDTRTSTYLNDKRITQRSTARIPICSTRELCKPDKFVKKRLRDCAFREGVGERSVLSDGVSTT